MTNYCLNHLDCAVLCCMFINYVKKQSISSSWCPEDLFLLQDVFCLRGPYSLHDVTQSSFLLHLFLY